jgi:polyhydroxyalkanoate synthesis regulator phasin
MNSTIKTYYQELINLNNKIISITKLVDKTNGFKLSDISHEMMLQRVASELRVESLEKRLKTIENEKQD